MDIFLADKMTAPETRHRRGIQGKSRAICRTGCPTHNPHDLPEKTPRARAAGSAWGVLDLLARPFDSGRPPKAGMVSGSNQEKTMREILKKLARLLAAVSKNPRKIMEAVL